MFLYCYQYHCYQIHLILGSLQVHPRTCLIPKQYLSQFPLQDSLQGFLQHIFCINSLLCRPKWVFLVPTQTLDIGQGWVVFQILLVLIPSWKNHSLWVIQPDNRCKPLYRCISTWIIVQHIHSISLRQCWGCFFSSIFLFYLCITWRRIQINFSSC